MRAGRLRGGRARWWAGTEPLSQRPGKTGWLPSSKPASDQGGVVSVSLMAGGRLRMPNRGVARRSIVPVQSRFHPRSSVRHASHRRSVSRTLLYLQSPTIPRRPTRSPTSPTLVAGVSSRLESTRPAGRRWATDSGSPRRRKPLTGLQDACRYLKPAGVDMVRGQNAQQLHVQDRTH